LGNNNEASGGAAQIKLIYVAPSGCYEECVLDNVYILLRIVKLDIFLLGVKSPLTPLLLRGRLGMKVFLFLVFKNLPRFFPILSNDRNKRPPSLTKRGSTQSDAYQATG